jgi:diguanylate cyclase (GGDEF)-like protein/PAS domain S-box-containing protein
MNDELFDLDENGLFSALMDNMADSIYFKDRQCRLMRVSHKMVESLGFNNPAELIGKTDIELFGEEFGNRTRVDDLRVMETGIPIVGLVEGNQTKTGEMNWTSTTKFPIRNTKGKIIGLLGITREINDLKKIELDLQHIATHDLLTSLPNRYLFFDRLDQAILRAKRYQTSFALLYLDLDRFKRLNDQNGHDAGDKILVQVAKHLKETVRGSDTVARLGGDEFAILMEVIQHEDEAVSIAERIVQGFGEASMLGVTASIGISIYPRHGEDGTVLLKCADDAMYQAKKKKNSFRMYELCE